MTTHTLSAAENLADLLEFLGGIPAARVRMHPPPGTATEHDLLTTLEGPRKRICELIDGVLVEKPMGFNESILASYLIALLNAYVRDKNLGIVSAPDGTVRLWAGRIRVPDVAFFSWERLPDRRLPAEPVPTLTPDVAIEILSSGNTSQEMRHKRDDYFAVGVRQVWEIDPEQRRVFVYTTAARPDWELSQADILDNVPGLPGFTLTLRELFGELDRHGQM